MNYYELLMEGRAHLAQYPSYEPVGDAGAVFVEGGRWMGDRLRELRGRDPRADGPVVDFNFYGCLKYGICLAGSGLVIVWAWMVNLWLMPLAGLVFYILEAPFVFLFPLLIDRVPKPLLTGLRMLRRIGLLRCLGTVIPISVFMLAGLFRRRNRIHQWYVGCMAIVIWYQYEVRNRISSSF